MDNAILFEDLRLGNITPGTVRESALDIGAAVVKPVTLPWSKGQLTEASIRGGLEILSLPFTGWTKAGRAKRAADAIKAAEALKVSRAAEETASNASRTDDIAGTLKSEHAGTANSDNGVYVQRKSAESIEALGMHNEPHIGAGGKEGFSDINPSSRKDNCSACTSAKVINQKEGLVGEDILTADHIERNFAYAGKELAFTLPKSLQYIEDATGMKEGQAVPFMDPMAEAGHYVVFPRHAGQGFAHVIYGEVLEDGSRYLYDAQIWKK